MTLTNQDILKIAMEQSAIDNNCNVSDFFKKENIITISKDNPLARKYLKLPHICNLVSYGDNIVAALDEKYKDIVEDYITKYQIEHCFETPNMHVLNDAFQSYGAKICFMCGEISGLFSIKTCFDSVTVKT